MAVTRWPIVAELSDQRIDDAARIWAEATAARDGDPVVASLRTARSVIEEALKESSDPVLLTALDGDGRAVGFALVLPASDPRPELRYLAVRSASWGQGIGRQLLDAAAHELRGRGYTSLQLWVNADNPRAATLYRGTGWRASGSSRPNPRSGRQMDGYTLELKPLDPRAGVPPVS